MCVLLAVMNNYLIGGFRSLYHAIRKAHFSQKGTMRFHLCRKQVVYDRMWISYLGQTVKLPTQAIKLPNDSMYAVDVTDPNLHLCFNIISGHLPGAVSHR